MGAVRLQDHDWLHSQVNTLARTRVIQKNARLAIFRASMARSMGPRSRRGESLPCTWLPTRLTLQQLRGELSLEQQLSLSTVRKRSKSCCAFGQRYRNRMRELHFERYAIFFFVKFRLLVRRWSCIGSWSWLSFLELWLTSWRKCSIWRCGIRRCVGKRCI